MSKLAAFAIKMVFLAKESIPVPTKDILSWIFDDVPYDQHKPVCDAPIPVFHEAAKHPNRSMLTPQSLKELYLLTKRAR